MKLSLIPLSGILLLIPLLSFISDSSENEIPQPPAKKYTNVLDQRFKDRVDRYLNNGSETLDTALVSELRSLGYQGLDWLRASYPSVPETHEEYIRQTHAMKLYDKVSGQKDALYADLFWHKDLNTAKALAIKENKMILSLRMLGDLSEDLSCANSRYFRTILYCDTAISNQLRKNFILHVTSVIEVPKITIEYPDGSIQKQTITGNSMHIIMQSDGKIFDALPGLYAPETFSSWLQRCYEKRNDLESYVSETAKRLRILSEQLDFVPEVEPEIPATQAEPTEASPLPPEGNSRTSSAISPISFDTLRPDVAVLSTGDSLFAAPFIVSSMTTASKIAIESPLMYNWTFGFFDGAVLTEKVEQILKKDTRHIYRVMQRNGIRLKPVTSRLIAIKRSFVDSSELKEYMNAININVAAETVRNQLKMHNEVLRMFSTNPLLVVAVSDSTLRSDDVLFTKRVYKELFNTPLDDKKMGLYDPKLFYAITNDGF